MHRAHLAYEACAKFLKNFFDCHQSLPKSGHSCGVVGSVLRIFVEWYRIRDLDRHKSYLDVNPEIAKLGQEFAIKIGNRFRDESDGSAVAFAGLNRQNVAKEIELNLKDSMGPWNCGRGETNRIDV